MKFLTAFCFFVLLTLPAGSFAQCPSGNCPSGLMTQSTFQSMPLSVPMRVRQATGNTTTVNVLSRVGDNYCQARSRSRSRSGPSCGPLRKIIGGIGRALFGGRNRAVQKTRSVQRIPLSNIQYSLPVAAKTPTAGACWLGVPEKSTPQIISSFIQTVPTSAPVQNSICPDGICPTLPAALDISNAPYSPKWRIRDGKNVWNHLIDGFPGRHAPSDPSIVRSLGRNQAYRVHDRLHDINVRTGQILAVEWL